MNSEEFKNVVDFDGSYLSYYENHTPSQIAWLLDSMAQNEYYDTHEGSLMYRASKIIKDFIGEE